MPHRPGNGAIFGIVSEDAVSKEDFPVTLIDRSNGKLVSRQMSDHNGGFVFNGLNPDTDDYQVVAQDEDNPPYKNAIIRDRIQPVRGYQGASYNGNWRLKAAEYGALAYFDGTSSMYYDEDDSSSGLVHSYGAKAPVYLFNGSGNNSKKPVFYPSITPGDPSTPATDLNNGVLVCHARTNTQNPSTNYFGVNQDPSHTSLELVADFSSLVSAKYDSGSKWVYFGGFNYRDYKNIFSDNYAVNVIKISYNKESKLLRVYINNGGNNNHYPLYNGNQHTVINNFDMSSFQGVHHIAATVKYGDKATLYIDGQEVERKGISDLNSSIGRHSSNGYGWPGGVAATGNAGKSTLGGNTGVSGKVPILAWYSRELTAHEVEDLYKAIMIGTEPQLTGYAKEVYVDRPSIYVRLNEPSGSQKAKNQVRLDEKFYPEVGSSVSFGHESIVTGGSTAKFTGSKGIRLDNEDASFMTKYGFSIEFIAKPDPELGSVQDIVRCGDHSSNFTGFVVRILSDGALDIIFKSGGGSETVSFSTIIDTSEMHHYLFSVDKIKRTACLYIDGLLEEEVSTEAGFLDVNTSSTETNRRRVFMMGGDINGTNDASNGYKGLLGEVSSYSNPLSALRAKQHFDALQVV